jgi:hypothetical protein
MKIRLFHALLIVLLIPSIASCSQSELSSKWLQEFAPLQDNFSISKRFKQQQAEFDFNDDGLSDTIYYTDVVGDISVFSSVHLVQPWLKMDDQKQGAKTAIVIIHGSSSLAEGSLPAVGLLPTVIHDKNDISVLDTSAMLQSEVIKKEMIIQLEEPELSARAKGDIVLIPTEAGIDSFIYWDGSSYQLYEVIDMP